MNVSVATLERVMARVEKTDTCWLWQGCNNGAGYGRTSDGDGRPAYVHRLVYEGLVRPIPDGMEIHHACRVRNCVNPAHLALVTPFEHMLRDRQTHCKSGHEFTLENTYLYARGGIRQCKACRAERLARYGVQIAIRIPESYVPLLDALALSECRSRSDMVKTIVMGCLRSEQAAEAEEASAVA